ncbi:hypothetical protein ABT116_18025 [Streptomyces sp. NPDC002130]|uniref:hypothetical protein n=1 Tax=Streptomyces sp. NPDC002130 TaxID=3155568 RepID=UPI0033181B13
MMAFLTTGMDTTPLSLAAAVRLFTEHPDQWDALRADPPATCPSSAAILTGFGIGLSGAVGTAAITGSLGHGQQGVASAMNDTTREVGSAAGIALMGSIYGSHHRSFLPSFNCSPKQRSPYATRQPRASTSPVSSAPGARPTPTVSRAHSRAGCPLP